MSQVNAILLLAILLGQLFSASQLDQPTAASAAVRQEEGRAHRESNFYYDGKSWRPSRFQCDGEREVAVMLGPEEATTQSLLKFLRIAPAAKQTLTLERLEEPDCAMMKCWWHFRVNNEARRFLSVQESHYYEPADGFWSSQYKLGFTSDRQATGASLTNCRWLPRTRVAAITERRSIYITETRAGRLVLRTYDYGRDRVSLTASNGVSRVDERGKSETFTFQQGRGAYVIVVSLDESKPEIEISHTRNKRISREHPLSYNYVAKLK